MITISQDRYGYIIKLEGLRNSFRAKTIQEVHSAIDHYFRNHFHDEGKCPLCKDNKNKVS